jgi:integrase
MASVQAMLYTYRESKNGEYPIYLRIIKDRKPRYMSVGFSCSRELWDEKNSLPKKKHPLYHELLVHIETKKMEANKLLLDLSNDKIDYSADQVKQDLQQKQKPKQQVLEFFETVIQSLKDQERLGTAEVFHSTKNNLSKFRKGKDFAFTEITPAFLGKYEEFCIGRGNALTTRSVYMRTFQRLVNLAKTERFVKKDFDPFNEYGFAKFRKPKTRKRAIPKDDIMLIKGYEAEVHSARFHAKNYFLFSYYTRGTNFTDIAKLKWSDISYNRVNYTRTKSKKPFSIGLLEPANEILAFYKEHYDSGPDDFVFPILNPKFLSPVSIKNRIKKVLAEVNRNLKEISQAVGIEEKKLTTYVARHTYATVMKKSGHSISVISEALGHDSEHTTQIYLNSFENDVLDEASKAIL